VPSLISEKNAFSEKTLGIHDAKKKGDAADRIPKAGQIIKT
jgi:hypothetical protein